MNFDDFYILQLSSDFSIKREIQYMGNCTFSDNCKIYYNKSFNDAHNLDIVQANVSFHNN